ncbi:translation initiation factor eIF2 assembly protein-like [Oscarella lobularis]|uniref:translation initiation factor eIF2 assembly protein-like n=1 Tax=Oscarella lobularis TaxID=121494 RepID=UPI0033140C8D
MENDDFQPVATKERVIQCMTSQWYSQFAPVTIKTEFVSLKPDFVHYLNEDGIVLPQSLQMPAAYGLDDVENALSDWSSDDDDDNKEDAKVHQPNFSELNHEIQSVIDRLDGAVFPKLNWSSPSDAKWISHTGTMKCTTVSDVYLLLKSSNRTSHDLNEAFVKCSDYDGSNEPPGGFQLVLRQWEDLLPGMEFRCFVQENKLLAVCQRDYTTFYEYLDRDHEAILKEIEQFFKDYIQGRFSDVNYTFDVYRRKKNRFWIIDFNPFHCVTETLLFTWQELTELALAGDSCAAFRFVTSEAGIQPSKDAYSRLPQDFLDFSVGSDVDQIVGLLKEIDEKERLEPVEKL